MKPRSYPFRMSPRVAPVPIDSKAYGTPVYWASVGGSQTLDTKIGVKDPRWKEKVASGVDATNPYTRTVFPLKTGVQLPVKMRWTGKVQAYNPNRLVPYSTYLEGYYAQYLADGAFGLDGSVTHPEIDTLAKLAFLAKVKDAQSQFNAPVFVGELRETIRMLRHPLQGFTKATHRYRQRVKRLRAVRDRAMKHTTRQKLARNVKAELLIEHANRFQSSLEKAFLQWTYGVAPLMNDVQALLELPALMGKAEEVMRLSVTIPKQFIVRAYTGVTTFNSVVFLRGINHQRTDAEYKCQYRGALRVRGNPPNGVDRLRELTAANLREFVPTLYELIPFSFVADYFSTLGSVVNGVFTCTEDLVYCCNTRKVSTVNTGVFVPLPGTQYPVDWPWIPAAAQLKGKRLNRVKADLSVNLRDLQFTMPNSDQLFKTAVLSVSLLRGALGDK